MAFGDFTVDRNSTKYVLGSGGTIIPSATDEPAFEFNADGTYKGLLVEPAATNIAVQSEDITTTPWFVGNATRTANATTAPDGYTTADKLVGSGGGTGSVIVYQTITVSAATKYTASVFLKADQLSFARLDVLDYTTTGTDGSQFFGLSGNGSLGTASNLDDSSITAYPDGWYRCTITWTQGASPPDTSSVLVIRLASSISTTTVNLDGTSSIFVWGAQVEASPIATSYIPTASAAVTRVKDDITQTGAQSLIGQTEGTLYLEVDFKATGAEQHILSVSDGTSTNWLLIWANGGDTRSSIYVGGSGVSSVSVANLSDGVQKFALAYANGDQEFYRNGSSIGTGTGSLTSLPTLTDIDLLQSPTAARQPNMWIRAVALYPTRLGAVELEVLTGAPTYGSYALMASSLGYTVA